MVFVTTHCRFMTGGEVVAGFQPPDAPNADVVANAQFGKAGQEITALVPLTPIVRVGTEEAPKLF